MPTDDRLVVFSLVWPFNFIFIKAFEQTCKEIPIGSDTEAYHQVNNKTTLTLTVTIDK